MTVKSIATLVVTKQHSHDGHHTCILCNNKFDTEDQLKQHLHKHSQDDFIACNFCEEKIQTQEQLNEHIKSHHTIDGDWNCDDCDHQTNSEEGLMKHLISTHHNSQQIPNPKNKNLECNSCESKFYDRKTLEEHKKRTHKSFKPCRNLPNCRYGSDCIFNHGIVNNDMYLCYECGEETKTLDDLMLHRKKKHVVNDCLKHLTNSCPYGIQKCWFIHKEQILHDKPSNLQVGVVTNPQLSVFRDSPANLAPPAAPLTQATWVKMVQMLNDLNRMMQEMKETGRFQ